MNAIEFPEVNVRLAEDQPEYETLPVFLDKNKGERPMTACFELSDEEVAEINTTRKIWHTQWTFGNPFQPIRMSTSNPFIPPSPGKAVFMAPENQPDSPDKL